MSDNLLRAKAEERTARVWQPADYLGADTVSQAFQASSWMDRRTSVFVVPTFERPELPELEVVEDLPVEVEALAAEPAVVLPPPAEPAVHSAKDLEAERQQAFEEGRQQGLREASAEHAAQAQAWRDQAASRLLALERGIGELIEAPDQLHEPLKRLSLHLAEQLVIGELSLSPQAIERLVRRCVDELDAQRGAPVRVELHPDDLGPLQELLGSLSPEGSDAAAGKTVPWLLQANASVLPGSVRASANDAMVFDLIEHRLEALAGQLLRVPAAARQQSAFKPERLAARKAEVSQVLDAQPRMAEPGRSGRFAPVIEADAAPVEDPSDDNQRPDALPEPPAASDAQDPSS